MIDDDDESWNSDVLASVTVATFTSPKSSRARWSLDDGEAEASSIALTNDYATGVIWQDQLRSGGCQSTSTTPLRPSSSMSYQTAERLFRDSADRRGRLAERQISTHQNKLEQELAQCTFRPAINKESCVTPPHRQYPITSARAGERSQNLYDIHADKQRRLKHMQQEEESRRRRAATPEVTRLAKSLQRGDFLSTVQRWDELRRLKRAERQIHIEQEVAAESTFVPTVCPKSAQLEAKPSLTSRVDEGINGVHRSRCLKLFDEAAELRMRREQRHTQNDRNCNAASDIRKHTVLLRDISQQEEVICVDLTHHSSTGSVHCRLFDEATRKQQQATWDKILASNKNIQ